MIDKKGYMNLLSFSSLGKVKFAGLVLATAKNFNTA